MATTIVVAKALAAMQGIQVKEITGVMTEAFVYALRTIDDATVERGVGRAIDTLRFFPSPGEFRDLCGANAPAAVDLDRLCGAIGALGEHNPHVGWVYPRAELVRERFGDGIGAAYADAGGARVFADNETTRDIARREFAKALAAAPLEELRRWLVGAAQPKRLLSDGAPVQPLPAPRVIRGVQSAEWEGKDAAQAIADVAKARAMDARTAGEAGR